MFFENRKSMENLKEHRETPHLKALRQIAGSLLTKPIAVTLFEMISKAWEFGENAGLS
jgi:quinol monooxygenase YgiN